MTDSPPDPEPSPDQRIDYTSPSAIAGSLIAMAIILCSVPVFWIFLPFAAGALVLLYLVHDRSLKTARARARSHLGPSATSELDVELGPGMTSALVINDWGVVFARFCRSTIELAWGDIRLVDEPVIAMLAFHTHDAMAFQADLSQDRYYLATQAIHSKIPDRTDFDVDPVTGRSNLLRKLQRAPLEWRGRWGHVVVSTEGVEHDRGSMSWEEIESVREFSFPGDESESFWELRFTSAGLSFDLRSTNFSDGRQVGNSGYDTIKAVVAQRIPTRVVFDRPPPLPSERAIWEFNRGREAYQGALSIVLKSGKPDKVRYLERSFRHMLTLVDLFALDGEVETRAFFRDYADLMARSNRPDEAARLQARADAASPARRTSC